MADFKIRDALFNIYREDIRKNLHAAIAAGKLPLCEYFKFYRMIESPDEEAVKLACALIEQKLNGSENEQTG